MTPLLNVPTSELLYLWSELEQAYHGTHGFGGDTAEIYAYRLCRDNPLLRAYPEGSDLLERVEREQAQEAYANLRAVLTLFAEMRGASITVDGQPLGLWNKAGLFVHRAHVTVRPGEGI